MEEGRDRLACAVLEHLNSKSTLPTIFNMPHEFFRKLCHGKRRDSNEKGWILLEECDFFS
jgi:hypothetical protein